MLADEDLSAEEITSRIQTQEDATYRLLRLLAALGVFEEVTPRVFRNNKLSNCLREGNPQNVRAMILTHNSSEMNRPWYEQLEQGIRSGDAPFRLTHGQELFAYLDEHAEFDGLFSKAMDSVEALAGDSFATDFDWARFDRIIDIGGSKGRKSIAILKRHPHLKALVMDRTQVIQGAAQYWYGREDHALLERLSFQAGDLLERHADVHGDTRQRKDAGRMAAAL